MYNYEIAKIEHFKEMFVTEFTPDQVIAFAEELLGGGLTVGYKAFEILRYNPHKLECFNWEAATTKNANTFSLYLFGLRHLYLLAKAYEYNPNLHYLELCNDFLFSFERYITQNSRLHGMVNNDHAISERIENLAYLYCVAETAGYRLSSKQFLISQIEDSVKKLLTDTYYQRRHNHGIIVDKAALIGLHFLNQADKKKQIEFVVSRLTAQVDHAFSKDGVHKENSIDYHFSVVVLLWGCYHALKHIKHEYSEVLYNCLDKANRFIIYALKPDGFRPLFGDSKGIPTTQKNADGFIKKPKARTDIFNDDPYLRYIYSQGNEGTPPESLSILFPSGYAFFREHFRREDYQGATWLSLKAGYSTRIHKHKDDLSLCLYSKGFDIFVDSGMCGYMPRDRLKDYMESIPAHTTLGIKGGDYSIASANSENFIIQRFARGERYDYAMASTSVYNDTYIYRHVYYMRKKDIVIIRDEIYSEKEQVYFQYFNLSNYVFLSHKSSKNNVELKIGDSDYSAIIRQMRAVDELRILEGDKTSPGSYISTGFGSSEESSSLEYSINGTDVQFITVVEIRRSDEVNSEITILPDEILVGTEKTKVPIDKTMPVMYHGADITCEGNKLTIDILSQEDERLFTYYVFTEDDIIKNPQSSHNILIYEPQGKQTFTVMLYIANRAGEKIKGIIGDFYTTKAGIVAKKVYKELHRPYILSKQFDKLKRNHYRYTVEYKYDYNVTFKWWVYYNGSCLHSEQNTNRIFDFEFANSGEYVVMYSMHDRFFGEIVFDQFEKILHN